ncbi:MAG: hypothetical protein DRN20_04255 [Thermoplasmata archaeon]|nr:MAG: hypothetical protein DRN20_04255 [Thermoplasmata archaeon]
MMRKDGMQSQKIGEERSVKREAIYYNVICTIRIMHPDAAIAAKALHIDNEEYVEQTIKGGEITATIRSQNILNALNTINDYLACLSLALKTLKTIGDSTKNKPNKFMKNSKI